MSELLQDVQFSESDSKEELIRKLRVLQDEVITLSRVLALLSIDETGILDFGTVALNNAATAGLYPVPGNAAGFIEITVNGSPARIPVFLP